MDCSSSLSLDSHVCVDIEETMRGKRSYRTFIQWGVALAILVFLGKMVWENWSQVREASFAFRLLPFLLATFLFILSYFIQVWAWYVITLRLGIAIPIKETLVSWSTHNWESTCQGRFGFS